MAGDAKAPFGAWTKRGVGTARIRAGYRRAIWNYQGTWYSGIYPPRHGAEHWRASDEDWQRGLPEWHSLSLQRRFAGQSADASWRTYTLYQAIRWRRPDAGVFIWRNGCVARWTVFAAGAYKEAFRAVPAGAQLSHVCKAVSGNLQRRIPLFEAGSGSIHDAFAYWADRHGCNLRKPHLHAKWRYHVWSWNDFPHKSGERNAGTADIPTGRRFSDLSGGLPWTGQMDS